MIDVAPLRGPEIGRPVYGPGRDRPTSTILRGRFRGRRPVDPAAGMENAFNDSNGPEALELAFPTTAWTGFARPQAPQAQRQLSLEDQNQIR